MSAEKINTLPSELKHYIAEYRVENYKLLVTCTRCKKPCLYLDRSCELKQRDTYYSVGIEYWCEKCYKEYQ